MDVKTEILYGDLDETIMMKQPERYEEKGKEDYVCQLNRSLYGLKHSPRKRNRRFSKFMAHIGFTRSNFNHCVYFRFSPEKFTCQSIALCGWHRHSKQPCRRSDEGE